MKSNELKARDPPVQIAPLRETVAQALALPQLQLENATE